MPQLELIKTRKHTIHLRLYQKQQKTDLEWLQTFDLQVNRSAVQLIRKKTRTAPVSDPFVIPPPIIMPPFVPRAQNQFNFQCPREFVGYLVVQLVSPVSTAQVRHV